MDPSTDLPPAVLKAYAARGYTPAQLRAASVARALKDKLHATPKQIAPVGPALRPLGPMRKIEGVMVAFLKRPGASGPITAKFIQQIVCEEYDLPVREMLSRRRPARIAIPRHVAMWLCRELTEMSYPEIARRFKRSDHTCSLNSCERVEAMREADAAFAHRLDDLKARIRGEE